jgi:hypothetical protein
MGIGSLPQDERAFQLPSVSQIAKLRPYSARYKADMLLGVPGCPVAPQTPTGIRLLPIPNLNRYGLRGSPVG